MIGLKQIIGKKELPQASEIKLGKKKVGRTTSQVKGNGNNLSMKIEKQSSASKEVSMIDLSPVPPVK